MSTVLSVGMGSGAGVAWMNSGGVSCWGCVVLTNSTSHCMGGAGRASGSVVLRGLLLRLSGMTVLIHVICSLYQRRNAGFAADCQSSSNAGKGSIDGG